MRVFMARLYAAGGAGSRGGGNDEALSLIRFGDNPGFATFEAKMTKERRAMPALERERIADQAIVRGSNRDGGQAFGNLCALR